VVPLRPMRRSLLVLAWGLASCTPNRKLPDTRGPPVPIFADAGTGGATETGPASERTDAGDVTPGSHALREKWRNEVATLIDEMTQDADPVDGRGGLRGAMMMYAYAFAGYALVDMGLDDASPGGATWAREGLERLVERALRPSMGAPFDAAAFPFPR
jgi:hypothetical protein